MCLNFDSFATGSSSAATAACRTAGCWKALRRARGRGRPPQHERERGLRHRPGRHPHRAWIAERPACRGALVAASSHLGRYEQVGEVLARHGLGFLAEITASTVGSPRALPTMTAVTRRRHRYASVSRWRTSDRRSSSWASSCPPAPTSYRRPTSPSLRSFRTQRQRCPLRRSSQRSGQNSAPT